MTMIAHNLATITAAIAAAEKDARRAAGTTQLIAVSKTFGTAAIETALAAGQRHFGENYVQEALEKWPPLKEQYPDIVLHMIGPLQSNKTRQAVELFDAIHTLDRPSLAKAIAKEGAKRGHLPTLLIQVNTGEEPQKGGVTPQQVPAFLRECREDHGLEIAGLMCIPPAGMPPAPHFALLQQMAKDHGLPQLSMGMSDDFRSAIGFGTTMVRIGTAIFGGRAYAPT